MKNIHLPTPKRVLFFLTHANYCIPAFKSLAKKKIPKNSCVKFDRNFFSNFFTYTRENDANLDVQVYKNFYIAKMENYIPHQGCSLKRVHVAEVTSMTEH